MCNYLFLLQVSPARATLLVEGRDRILSFHERATSKDVIDELNRMIRKGEDNTGAITNNESQVALEKLDLACCCPTGWVHVERDIDFTDPKVICPPKKTYFLIRSQITNNQNKII